ncbi:DUF397 domain-containing protein [Streptomyces sp. NPDC004647]|uniref:DUF397 domain-containing protein n=1 Tax=Streptomyces sp. NPDC004647 TaxID=3154671 RepID=UPI0033A4A0A8
MSNAASPRHSDDLAWSKSSYSGDEGGNCIEVAADASAVHVRDSKDPDGPVLTLTPDAWADFVRFADGIG